MPVVRPGQGQAREGGASGEDPSQTLTPRCYNRPMHTPPKFMDDVLVWKDGDVGRWCPLGEWAPEGAVIGDRYRGPDGKDVIFVKRGVAGEYIRGAVKDSRNG